MQKTTVDVDDRLLKEALHATGLGSASDVVELGLRTVVRMHQQELLRDLRGKLAWEGDLSAMRADN